jgi:enterochelin esterase-like enzyme
MRYPRLLLLAVLSLCAQACFAGQGGFVDVHGRDFIGPDGQVLRLRGANLGFWLEPESYPMGIAPDYRPSQYFDLFANLVGPDESRAFWRGFQDNFITRDDIQYLKRIGINSVRLPFDYRLFADEYFLGSREPRGFELLDRAVGWCREAGIYVILDMHCAPGTQAGWSTDDGYLQPWLFEDNGEESRRQLIDLWVSIARHYADEPTVLGYDLLGEPISQYCDTARINPRLEPLYKRVVAAIRKVDGRHIIILEGAFWARNFDVFGPPFDPRLAYSTHLYDSTAEYTSLQYFIDFGRRNNVPVWLGEFGETDAAWVALTRRRCESSGIGWCLWPIKKMDNDHDLLRITQPAGFSEIQKFLDATFPTLDAKIKAAPPYAVASAALKQYLVNCRFENCTPSKYYLEALGLNVATPPGVNPPADRDGDFVIGPAYAPAPELSVRAGVPRGTVTSFTMDSADSRIFPGITRVPPGGPANFMPPDLTRVATYPKAYTRTVTVYIPAQYVPGTPAPVLVVQDGPDKSLPVALDNLIAEGRVPAMVAVMVQNGGGDAQGSERGLEYDTMSGRYAEFIEREVFPLVEARCGVKITGDPDGRAAMGGSSGAAAAFTMAWYHPEWYHRVVSYSGTFVNQQSPFHPGTPHGAWEYHEHLIPESPRKPIRIWMQVGDRDLYNPNSLRDGMHDWVEANNRMAAVLKAKGYHYQYVTCIHAGHVDRDAKAQTLPEALEWVWRGYKAGD